MKLRSWNNGTETPNNPKYYTRSENREQEQMRRLGLERFETTAQCIERRQRMARRLGSAGLDSKVQSWLEQCLDDGCDGCWLGAGSGRCAGPTTC